MANYFASREQEQAPAPTNHFAAQEKAQEVTQEETFRETPVADQLESTFGSPEDYKSPAEHAQTMASDAIKWASDRIVDMGFTAAKAIIPDDWEDVIVDYSERGWSELMKNDGFRTGIEMAQAGMDKYGKWAKENPELARRLEEVVNIGAVGMKPVTPNTPLTYPKLERRVTKRALNNRKGAITEMMEPIGKKGEGTLRINPDTKRKEYVPSKWEQDVNEVVMKVPQVDPKAPYTDNMNAVRDASRSYRQELDSLLKGSEGVVDKQAIKTGLANRVNSLHDETLLTGNAFETATKIYKKAETLIDESDGTVLGLLNARRQLDNWVRDQRGVFDSQFENATTVSLRHIRGFLNDKVAEAAAYPTHVKALLDRQHKLLTAGDLLESKALREADGWIGRMINKWENKTGEKIPTTPYAQAATVAFLAGKSAVVAPIAGLVSTYKGLKWLGTPEGKLWILRAKDIAKQQPMLAPEINGIIQLAEGLDPEEDRPPLRAAGN